MDLDAILSSMSTLTKDRTIREPPKRKERPESKKEQSLDEFLRNYDPSNAKPPKKSQKREKNEEKSSNVTIHQHLFIKQHKLSQAKEDEDRGIKEPEKKIVLIQNPKHSLKIVKKLKREKLIALDCEGVNLGRAGKLCLIQISTDKNKVYLFDVVIGNLEDIFERGGLRDLLEDPNIIKIIHDCRGDSDALYHQGGVKLTNVFDSQIAYAIYIRQSGSQTPIPVGLNTLLKKYTQYSNSEKVQARQEMANDESYWLKRPLSESMIEYAAQDVLYLPVLYRKLKALLSQHSLKQTLIMSIEYSGVFRDSLNIEEAKSKTYVNGLPKYGIPSWDNNLEFFMSRRRTSSVSSTLSTLESSESKESLDSPKDSNKTLSNTTTTTTNTTTTSPTIISTTSITTTAISSTSMIKPTLPS